VVASLTNPESRTEARAVPAVRTQALGYLIENRPILRDVSVYIPQGQFTALLGANGAGKSTLLKMLATLTQPTQGRLHLFGIAVNRDSAKVRSRIGLIGHGAMLYRDLTAMDNLIFFGRLYGLPDPAQRAEKLLRFVGLSSRRDDPVKTFSRGMVQRVSIARALMHDPDLLLADEPFSGLDAPSSRVLVELLNNLRAQDKTIMLATHDIDQAFTLADQVIVLRRGRVVIDSPVFEVDAQITLSQIEVA
jgi:heme exporter protein A